MCVCVRARNQCHDRIEPQPQQRTNTNTNSHQRTLAEGIEFATKKNIKDRPPRLECVGALNGRTIDFEWSGRCGNRSSGSPPCARVTSNHHHCHYHYVGWWVGWLVGLWNAINSMFSIGRKNAGPSPCVISVFSIRYLAQAR